MKREKEANLTDDERKVVVGVARGEKREAIAQQLGTTANVIDNKLQFIYSKCGVRGIVPLTHWAILNNMVKVGDVVR